MISDLCLDIVLAVTWEMVTAFILALFIYVVGEKRRRTKGFQIFGLTFYMGVRFMI